MIRLLRFRDLKDRGIVNSAKSRADAERAAIAAFNKWTCEDGLQALSLGLPSPWDEHDSLDQAPEIDTRFRCVDCAQHTGDSGEY